MDENGGRARTAWSREGRVFSLHAELGSPRLTRDLRSFDPVTQKNCGAERPRMYFVVQCGFAPQRLYAGFSAAASSQMLRSRVSGIRNRLSTKAIAGTAIG